MIQPPLRYPDFFRFIEKVDLYGAGGCWIWTGAVRKWSKEPWDGGYGAFWLNGKVVRAHLFAYQWFFGAIPEGHVLLHKCDNRRCVNVIDHVRPGTQLQNIADMVAKGRTTKGRPRTRRFVRLKGRSKWSARTIPTSTTRSARIAE